MRVFEYASCGRRARSAAALVLLVAGLGACAAPYYQPGPRAGLGALAGAAGGGLLGAAAGNGGAEAIAAGVLLGGLLGGALGDALDRTDRRYAAHSFDRGLEYRPAGRPSTWHNPDTGHSGSLTPVRTYQDDYGYCREFVHTVTVEGQTERAYGTACRQTDGSWRVDQ